jgi:hypothetical protein
MQMRIKQIKVALTRRARLIYLMMMMMMMMMISSGCLPLDSLQLQGQKYKQVHSSLAITIPLITKIQQ